MIEKLLRFRAGFAGYDKRTDTGNTQVVLSSSGVDHAVCNLLVLPQIGERRESPVAHFANCTGQRLEALKDTDVHKIIERKNPGFWWPAECCLKNLHGIREPYGQVRTRSHGCKWYKRRLPRRGLPSVPTAPLRKT